MYLLSHLIPLSMILSLSIAGVLLVKDAPIDLRVISQPKGWPRDWKPQGYAYDNLAGQGVTIYMVGQQSSDRYAYKTVYTKFSSGVPELEVATDTGTCQASKASSSLYGVSKLAKIVTVPTKPTLLNVMASLTAISNLIIGNQDARGKTVIHLAYGFEADGRISDREISLFYEILASIIVLGVVIVVPSGEVTNNIEVVNSVPALFSLESDYALKRKMLSYKYWGNKPGLPLIVVGATSNYGAPMAWSRGGPITLWAPGKFVACASKDRGVQARSTPSIQIQSASVAGLAAYYLSTISYADVMSRNIPKDQIPLIVIRDMKAFSYSRNPAELGLYPPVVWNGRDELKSRVAPGWQDESPLPR